MRRIYKTEILSSYYSDWIKKERFKRAIKKLKSIRWVNNHIEYTLKDAKFQYDELSEQHPTYDAGNVHYFDLRMCLFYCQKGLCAYTEEKLCKPSLLLKDKWNNGRYIEKKENINTRGHLEHFDGSLKKTKG
ncbi:MAG: hypothetical protein QM493_12050 [Sulfurovum sp.]